MKRSVRLKLANASMASREVSTIASSPKNQIVLDIIGTAFSRVTPFFLFIQFFDRLIPELIFAAFWPVILFPNLIGAFEYLLSCRHNDLSVFG
jgi:hypothetical protein